MDRFGGRDRYDDRRDYDRGMVALGVFPRTVRAVRFHLSFCPLGFHQLVKVPGRLSYPICVG